ncbi:MAG: hypothetical protein GY821_10720 [Gammaproteobacteria bacterium]|nr:hypothetical protein [Gammaproteobacteria bacterium]
MIRHQLKIVGYFSYTNSGTVFCDGTACIIVDSEEKMREPCVPAKVRQKHGKL